MKYQVGGDADRTLMVTRMTSVSIALESHGMTPARGFLPDRDPLTELPRGFEPWEEVARDLGKLLVAGRARRAIAALPMLGLDGLEDERALRRAMVVLSFLGHATVWGEDPPLPRVPECLAVPWCAVAARLGRPPILSYASYALDNWRRIDPDGPIDLDNIAIVQNFLGGADEDWFIGIHVETEAKAAPALREIPRALAAARAQDEDALAASLAGIARALESVVAVLRRMPEYCDPYIYYRRVRPYIHGWKDNSVVPEGIVYEGVAAFAGKPQMFRGETGAQSGIVPALDAALGVVHGDDPLRRYLIEMRDYMPPDHRAFVEAVEAAPSIRAFVESLGAGSDARRAHDACLHWLESFRSVHLEFAASYINDQSETGPANATAVGTGGTPFMAYLKKHRDDCVLDPVG